MNTQRLTRQRKMQVLICLGSILLVGTLFIVYAQGGNITVKKYNWPNEPVRVVSLHVGADKIEFGKPFQGTEEWADQFRVTVESQSTKTIKYLKLDLLFDNPETRYLLFLEWPGPPQPDQQGRPQYSNLELRHGEQATLSAHITVAQAKASIARSGKVAHFDEASLRISIAAFDDHTLWSVGTLFKEDPDHPSQFIKIADPPRKRMSKLSTLETKIPVICMFPRDMPKERVKLSQADQDFFMTMIAKGQLSARVFKRATPCWNCTAARPCMPSRRVCRSAIKLSPSGLESMISCCSRGRGLIVDVLLTTASSEGNSSGIES